MKDAIGVRLNPPHLHGVYLAVNAIPDAFLLADGPGCLNSKAEMIHGRHDLCSTLLDCRAEHRIQYSGIDIQRVATKYEQDILKALEWTASRPACEVVLLSGLPFTSLVGTDYERLARAIEKKLGKPVIVVPGSALTNDWLGAYGATMDALASSMDLSGARPEPGNVAVIGYLMDRTEGEHRANAAELERMLRSLSLNPVSVWLSNRPFQALRDARHASTIVSLPHGRKAAATLARRLGARLIEVGLPFGIDGTREWMERLGRETGREEQAAAFIRDELSVVAPRLEWVIPHAFVGRAVAFAGDPFYAGPLTALFQEVGASVRAMFLTGAPHLLPDPERARLADDGEVLFQPTYAEVISAWPRIEGSGVDLLVTNTQALELIRPKTPWLEWGYPSHYTHFLAEEPFLGFRGALSFLSRAANEITRGLYAAAAG